MSDQFALFDVGPSLPVGFRYEAAIISIDEEKRILQQVEGLPFRAFEFQGYLGNRRVVSFGWHYDFNERVLRKSEDMPPFLVELRETAAHFSGLVPDELQHVLVTEYSAGAGIGWHRDKGEFGQIVGISLLSSCRFRLRRKVGDRWERVSIDAEPRSAYLLSGAARSEWEHSIPPVEQLRYSITYRNLRSERE
jgi:alkylated DNA repair dioxygenase AlkB